VHVVLIFVCVFHRAHIQGNMVNNGRSEDGASWRRKNEERNYQGKQAPKSEGVHKPSKSGKASKGSLKSKIRGIERLVAHRGDSMPPSARTAAQAEVESLKALAAERSRRERERTLAKKYHMVKFFERRKIQRRLEAMTERAGRPGADAAALTARRNELESDLLYIRHFPKDKPYVALYPSDGHSEESRSAVEAIRREIQNALSGGGGGGESNGAANEKLKEEEASCEDDFFLADADDETS
jgi:hypothetical protein